MGVLRSNARTLRSPEGIRRGRGSLGERRRVFRGLSRDEPRGREAAPLYKLLFVVVLAAASFAGGAGVHSQGPRWAQELIQHQRGGDEADAPPAEEGQGPGDPPVEGEIPSRPLPPLGVEPAK